MPVSFGDRHLFFNGSDVATLRSTFGMLLNFY